MYAIFRIYWVLLDGGNSTGDINQLVPHPPQLISQVLVSPLYPTLLFRCLLFYSTSYVYSSPTAMETFLGLKGNYSQSPQGSDKVTGFLLASVLNHN